MERDLSDPFAFAVDPQDTLAGREAEIIDVNGHDLGDAGAGVEREQSDGLVTGRRAGLDGSQEPDLGPGVAACPAPRTGPPRPAHWPVQDVQPGVATTLAR